MEKYQQIKAYLESFINYENNVAFSYGESFKLERVKCFLRDLGLSYQDLKVIHVAGTKGKGSAATMCADLLAGSGYKIGLYTSPHFFDFRERIVLKTKDERRKTRDDRESGKIKTTLIARKAVVEIVENMRSYLEKWRDRKKFGCLTFFEVYTAVALKYFIDKKVDFTVLETGMGGRLDATNVVNPLVSIITRIGYDHTDKLGTKLADIAYEKAGIIKENSLVVCADQKRSVYNVIKKKCKEMNSKLFVLEKDFNASSVKLKNSYTKFDFKFNEVSRKNIKVRLKGRCQVDNACLSMAAVKLLKDSGDLKREINFSGINLTSIEGRFEVVKRNPIIVIDIAHNQSSFDVLKDNLKEYFPNKEIVLIFAAAQDKNIGKMLKIIKYKHLILTRFNNSRSAVPEDIKKKFRLKEAHITRDVSNALKIAKRLYNKDSLILIAGSFFLGAEAKKALNRL